MGEFITAYIASPLSDWLSISLPGPQPCLVCGEEVVGHECVPPPGVVIGPNPELYRRMSESKLERLGWKCRHLSDVEGRAETVVNVSLSSTTGFLVDRVVPTNTVMTMTLPGIW
jgi:hypothetical protein